MKTLRLMTSLRGWTTKPEDNTPANGITADELDGNFIQLYNDAAQVGTARLDKKTTPIPDGYLVLNGSTFDQVEYPALYTLLGSSNVLPDLTAESPNTLFEYRIRAK